MARRATAALLGAGLILTTATVSAAPGSTTTGSTATRTRDVSVTARGTVPAQVLLQPSGTAVRVDVTFSTTGRALTVEDGASVSVGSRTDLMGWAGEDLEHVRGTTYRATVHLPGTAEARGSLAVYLSATARATFGPGVEAYDEVVFDGARIAELQVRRPSKVTLGAYHVVDGGTVLYGDAGERVGTFSGGSALRTAPGAKVRLSFDPAGDARKRYVTTVTVGARDTFWAELPQKRTGTWTAELLATSGHSASTATKKVTIR
ncbi:hypothetical protein [Isoptericola sp. NPDC057559]|uniref:hypothetical protein n=1 Tax=Isoptericola sp. NPDC057559 TaxID=3346168 RepID=UPI0036B07242